MIYKKWFKFLILGVGIFFSFCILIYADNLFSDTWEVPFCSDGECGYQEWVKEVQDMVDNAETAIPLSDYIQDIVVYLLTFLSIIGVIYIMYAWFRIMIWWWSDESLKNSRKTILHVFIGLIVIWLAYSIVAFIIEILVEAWKTSI